MSKTQSSAVQKGNRGQEFVYYDSNIWIDWVLYPADDSNTATELFDQLEPDRRMVIVSNLLEYEVYHNLRKKFVKNSEWNGSTKKEIEKVAKKVSMAVEAGFERKLKQLLLTRKAIRKNADSDASKIDYRVLEKMKNRVGLIKLVSVCPECDNRVARDFKDKCPVCGKQISAMSKYEYHGLNGADLRHAYIAQSTGVRRFYTMDKGFQDLIKYESFSFEVEIRSASRDKSVDECAREHMLKL